MSAYAEPALRALEQQYVRDFPLEAAADLEQLEVEEAARVLVAQDISVVANLFQALLGDTQSRLIQRLPIEARHRLLAAMSPPQAVALLKRLPEEAREDILAHQQAAERREFQRLLDYPEDSAGALMDPRMAAFRADSTVAAAQAHLRRSRAPARVWLYVVDADGRLSGRVALRDFALAEGQTLLSELVADSGVGVCVGDTAPVSEVLEKLEALRLMEIPVVDFDQRLLGLIRHETLVKALQRDTSADMQAMVGASKEERALSRVRFAVSRRLPWLQVNLLTAFLAAAVVGIFESTIAQFTALAVLLPVVAGQSGNAGAQALAVTMRGLALREIGLRHWYRVMLKEARVGLFNGLAVAATTALGVYVWSQSWGLAAVITLAMVLSMVAAGLAGAVIPIALTRVGQDPATASSIILTTITDVVGFFSFLGIATAFAQWL